MAPLQVDVLIVPVGCPEWDTAHWATAQRPAPERATAQRPAPERATAQRPATHWPTSKRPSPYEPAPELHTDLHVRQIEIIEEWRNQSDRCYNALIGGPIILIAETQ